MRKFLVTAKRNERIASVEIEIADDEPVGVETFKKNVERLYDSASYEYNEYLKSLDDEMKKAYKLALNPTYNKLSSWVDDYATIANGNIIAWSEITDGGNRKEEKVSSAEPQGMKFYLTVNSSYAVELWDASRKPRLNPDGIGTCDEWSGWNLITKFFMHPTNLKNLFGLEKEICCGDEPTLVTVKISVVK